MSNPHPDAKPGGAADKDPRTWGNPGPPPRRRRRHRGLRVFAIVSVGLLAVIIAAIASASGAKWKARVEDYNVINPADLGVTVQVTNSGSAAGKPTCTVQAQDPSYAYNGVDIATLQNPVQPGQTATYVDNVTITNQGAQYVTQVTVSC